MYSHPDFDEAAASTRAETISLYSSSTVTLRPTMRPEWLTAFSRCALRLLTLTLDFTGNAESVEWCRWEAGRGACSS